MITMLVWSCAKTEAITGSLTFVVTANVHGQLDPCG